MSVAAGHHQAGTLPALLDTTVEMQPVEVHIRPMLTLTRALDLWVDDLEGRDYSARTVTEYSRYVGLLCDSLPRDTDVSKITLDDHIRPFLRRYRNRTKNTKASAEAAVCGIFAWLKFQRKITSDPCELLVRTRRPASEDLDVVTVSSSDIARMLKAAEGWPERLAINVAVYLGPRRSAISQLRISDYNPDAGEIRFREKGGKTISKPIPEDLADLIEEAREAGVYANQDYLVPSLRPHQVGKAERDDAVIRLIVKRVAKKAGVKSHVHALRAAFAVFYLAQNPGDVYGLKEALGHKHLTTTEIYLRKADKQKAMAPLRRLSWGVVSLDGDLLGEARNLRESLLGGAQDAPAVAANVRQTEARMGKGLAPNGRDEGSA